MHSLNNVKAARWYHKRWRFLSWRESGFKPTTSLSLSAAGEGRRRNIPWEIPWEAAGSPWATPRLLGQIQGHTRVSISACMGRIHPPLASRANPWVSTGPSTASFWKAGLPFPLRCPSLPLIPQTVQRLSGVRGCWKPQQQQKRHEHEACARMDIIPLVKYTDSHAESCCFWAIISTCVSTRKNWPLVQIHTVKPTMAVGRNEIIC